ncbi:hypothetical protein PoB_003102700 [Plakobranchus ocellatus]|uniref:Uncharacterized protein n=1 Tax=Plakobranchus ocellatus TaxID=259542 RepID=A0AAV4ABA6_9GAST|nr:hypothetical protein PoB_003102700 [Plakobranchus ocellatus]
MILRDLEDISRLKVNGENLNHLKCANDIVLTEELRQMSQQQVSTEYRGSNGKELRQMSQRQVSTKYRGSYSEELTDVTKTSQHRIQGIQR